MYKILIENYEKKYLLEELIKIFLRPDEYELTETESDGCIIFNRENYTEKNMILRQIYFKLSQLTGKKPEWGILIGIRPVKLAGEIYSRNESRNQTVKIFEDEYLLSHEKAELITDMYLYQQNTVGPANHKYAGIYIGIPFCPTRCVYCSFASNQVPESEIEKYLAALHKEIGYVGEHMKTAGIKTESIYIGGGTPTTLSALQLDELITHVKSSFDLSELKEFSVEAGRPDTITEEKLRTLKKHNINRISINPQSMKQETLDLIGRNHTPDDIRNAYELAESIGFDSINMDMIAGLPGESIEDFTTTLRELISFGADNITVHCLAVKRASRLKEIDKDFHYKQAQTVSEMLKVSEVMLDNAGYVPYYLYRQKHMAGAYENTGYCKKGKECIYNIRIMDEHQSIIALGAGGISKDYYPEENRLERVPNVTNYQEYISRIDEMLNRKEKSLFRR